MIKDINGSQQTIDRESNIIYDYLFYCVTTQPPIIVIREFQSLFVQGRNEDIKVSQALEKIIFASGNQTQFYKIFNHCFYLILNHWVTNPDSLLHVVDLLKVLETINQSSSYDRRRKQLIKLIKDYQQSKAYFKLKALIAIINPQEVANVAVTKVVATNEAPDSKKNDNVVTNSYLARYTYLYEYYVPQKDELKQLNQFVESLQKQRRQDFEIKLSRHIIYRFRLKQVAKMKLMSKGAGKIITKVDNPSLLSEKAFRVALQQYLGKVEGKQTILERSQRFIADHKMRNSYQIFKQDLHRFLTHNIKPRNSNYHFDRRLENKLEKIFVQSNTKPLNQTLVLQTCRQLFSFLIIDPNASNNPQEFVNLVVNLGTVQAITILLKIALICPDSVPDLEKKISFIVSHYQFHKIQDIPWLVKSLEHLLIAFSIYFGKIDVSVAKSVINNQ